MRHRQSSLTIETQYPAMSNGAAALAVGGAGGAPRSPPRPWAYTLEVTATIIRIRRKRFIIFLHATHAFSLTHFEIGRFLHLKSEISDWTLQPNTVQCAISDFGFEMQESSNFKIFPSPARTRGESRVSTPHRSHRSSCIMPGIFPAEGPIPHLTSLT